MATEASPTSAPPAKRRKIDFTDDIVVLVGKAEKRFVVHTNILCTSSNFFRKAVKGGWKEGQEKQVRLVGVQVSSFEVYIAWLYTGTLELGVDNDTDELDAGIISSKYFDASNEAAATGDFLEDRKFCNALVDHLRVILDSMKKIPRPKLVQGAYEMLPTNCGYCRLLVDFYSCQVKICWFEKYAEKLPNAFMIEIAMAAIRERPMSRTERYPRNRAKCYYHDHKDESDNCT